MSDFLDLSRGVPGIGQPRGDIDLQEGARLLVAVETSRRMQFPLACLPHEPAPRTPGGCFAGRAEIGDLTGPGLEGI